MTTGTLNVDETEILQRLEPIMEDNLELLKTVCKSWQPMDYLPDPSAESWDEEFRSLRSSAERVSDSILLVLVGNMLTEEALPNYQMWLNHLEGISDQIVTEESPWALWSRRWTAEENRHGDALNRYLYLIGRVDMRQVEVTTQHLIRNGFNSNTGTDLYKGFVYTSFQERATRVAHGNVSRYAIKQGEEWLGRLCGAIASDEARHETAYKNLVVGLFEIDPEGALLAFQAMMKCQITMPGSFMDDGEIENMYTIYSEAAQSTGVYTARDYSDIIKHLVEYWDIAGLLGLSGNSAAAQEYLCGLPSRYAKLVDRLEKRPVPQNSQRMPWIRAGHKRAI